MFLYSLAGYFRLFGIRANLCGTTLIILSVACSILTFLSVVLFDAIGIRIPLFQTHSTFFYGAQKFPVVVISVLAFLGFSKLDIQYNKIINTISSATFGVYLIHDNNYVRPFIWVKIFKDASYINSDMLIPYSFLVVIIVFIVCIIIELTRIHLIENKYMPLINKLAGFIYKKKDLIFSKACK